MLAWALLGPSAARAQGTLGPGEFGAAARVWAHAVHDLRSPADAAALESRIPEQVTVAEPGATPVEVPLGWLHAGLRQLGAQPWSGRQAGTAADLLVALQQRLVLLARQTEAVPAASPLPPGGRRQLAAILARREFRSVHGPTFWDVVRNRVDEALAIAVAWLASKLALNRQTSLWLAGLLLAAGAAALVLLGLRRPWRAPRGLGRLDAAAAAEDDWRGLRARARAAAQRGDWAGSLPLAYRAGLLLLAERGLWRMDATRTPREYLALLHPGANPRPPWRELVGVLEAAAYRGQPADAAASARALASLERLVDLGAAGLETRA